jgi:mono/diheme cytochrome c family protein
MNTNSVFLMAVLMGGAALARAAGPTVLDGVYTDAQAQRGQGVYEANCASCHKENLEGNPEAPALKGPTFMEVWRDDALDGLYQHMKTRMPRLPGGEPGSLTEAQYADIVAYVLKSNDYPAGQKELTPAAMATTMLVGPDGPKPLPNNALAQTVGCLAGEGDNWMVNRAQDATRTHDAFETTPEELKRLDAKGLGSSTFKLRLGTLMDNDPKFKPEPLAGKKVLIKGALVRQTGNDRFTVVSLALMAGAGCGQ